MSDVLTNRHKHKGYRFITVAGMTLYCACLTLMTVNSSNVSSSAYMLPLAMAICLSIALPLKSFYNCIFMTIPFTSVLKLPIESFSFMTLMQLLLIIRAMLSRANINIGTMVCIGIVCFISQLFPVVMTGQTMSNIILLVFNVLTFYCTFKLTYYGKTEALPALLSFALGVLISGLIALNYDLAVYASQSYRFAGLWTDPNFWGMFCLIGVISCTMAGFNRPILFIVLLPAIICLAMQGFLTLSRTFIFVSMLMVIVIYFTSLKKSIWSAIIIIGVIGVGVYYAIPYAEEILTSRDIDANDVSNGRFGSTLNFLEYIFNNEKLILFGLGYSNVLNYNDLHNISAYATHNTYADLFVEFGLVTDTLFIIGLFYVKKYIKALYKNIKTMPVLVVCILLFYMGTLSMLKYALVYLFLGTIIGYSYKLCINSKKLY